ncbi:hypothetical protein SARC_14634, partial [Sphaeroforma arctica JP610]
MTYNEHGNDSDKDRNDSSSSITEIGYSTNYPPTAPSPTEGRRRQDPVPPSYQ